MTNFVSGQDDGWVAVPVDQFRPQYACRTIAEGTAGLGDELMYSQGWDDQGDAAEWSAHLEAEERQAAEERQDEADRMAADQECSPSSWHGEWSSVDDCSIPCEVHPFDPAAPYTPPPPATLDDTPGNRPFPGGSRVIDRLVYGNPP